MNSAYEDLHQAVAEFKRAIADIMPEFLRMMALIVLGMVVSVVALLLDGSLTLAELFGGVR